MIATKDNFDVFVLKSIQTYYWEYVIECVFAVEGHIILKIWLILRI
jgi:hypothetical protein